MNATTASQPLDPSDSRRTSAVSSWFGVAVMALFVIMYWRAARELYFNWTLADSYYTHGFLVPFVSLFFVWRDREALARLDVVPTVWGFVWMAIAGLMLLFGDFLGFRVFGELSIIPMLTGSLLVFQGVQRTKRLWFPIAFLLFMIPIPPSMTQSIALQLKLVAAEAAVRLANLVTLPMVREGSFIHFGTDRLLVGDVCGGLRSLISLLALGAIVAYVSALKTWGRILLLALAGPIAVAANIVRIFFLCVVGYFWGSQVAGGRVHDLSGILIYAIAILLFTAVEVPLRRLSGEPSTKSALALAQPKSQPARRSHGSLFASALLFMVLCTLGHVGIIHAQAAAEDNASTAPDIKIPGQIVDYRQLGGDIPIDQRTKELLESSSILIRNYAAPTGRPIQLSVVHAGTTRRSLHFPEVCLVGAGWEIVSQDSVQIGILFSAKRLLLVKGDQNEAVLYWFKTGDYVTGNFFLNALQWSQNQMTFGSLPSSMIKLATPVAHDGEEPAFAALVDFAVKFSPVMQKSIP